LGKPVKASPDYSFTAEIFTLSGISIEKEFGSKNKGVTSLFSNHLIINDLHNVSVTPNNSEKSGKFMVAELFSY